MSFTDNIAGVIELFRGSPKKAEPNNLQERISSAAQHVENIEAGQKMDPHHADAYALTEARLRLAELQNQAKQTQSPQPAVTETEEQKVPVQKPVAQPQAA